MAGSGSGTVAPGAIRSGDHIQWLRKVRTIEIGGHAGGVGGQGKENQDDWFGEDEEKDEIKESSPATGLPRPQI